MSFQKQESTPLISTKFPTSSKLTIFTTELSLSVSKCLNLILNLLDVALLSKQDNKTVFAICKEHDELETRMKREHRRELVDWTRKLHGDYHSNAAISGILPFLEYLVGSDEYEVGDEDGKERGDEREGGKGKETTYIYSQAFLEGKIFWRTVKDEEGWAADGNTSSYDEECYDEECYDEECWAADGNTFSYDEECYDEGCWAADGNTFSYNEEDTWEVSW